MTMIRKSKTDKAEYECFTMKNGVCALIVSDLTIDTCSCAVSVGVGSFDDPTSTHGLAHFLEHMLFMGTEKYPGENEFFEFINRYGGNSNAVTMDEITTYYFDIAPEGFECAIDMFAHFFIDPLFKEDTVERELSAVNSEFLNGLNKDSWRINRMLEVFSNESTPASKFSVGNNRSLRKDSIFDEVRTFWKNKYFSDAMCVVMYGKEEIFKLKEYLSVFENIPRNLQESCIGREKTEANWGVGEYSVFKKEALNKWIRILPIVDKKMLVVSAIVPSEYGVFRNNPYTYISNLFHLRNKDGFIHRLKNDGLAFSANFEIRNNTEYSMVTITVFLSEEGSRRVCDVLEYMIEYFRGIKVDETEYNVMRAISECAFEYSEISDVLEQTEVLAERLQVYPVENILDLEFVFMKFEVEQIRGLLSIILDFRNWLVFHVTKDHGVVDLEEHMYGVRYSVGENIFDETTDKAMLFSKDFSNSESDGWISTENTHVLSGCKHEVRKSGFKEEFFSGGKITHLFNDSYMVPKAHICYLFRLHCVSRNIVNLMVVAKSAEELFHERYDHILQNMQISVSAFVDHDGLKVIIEGFRNGIFRVSRLFFDVFFGKISTDNHEIIIEEIRASLLSEKHASSYCLVTDGFLSLMIPGYSSPEEKIEMLGSVSPDFQMPTEFFIEVFSVGNVMYEDTEAILKQILSKQKETFQYKGISLLGKERVFRVKARDGENNACGLYYYSGKRSCYEDVAMSHLIIQLCQEMFFDTFRTKEELGYVVLSGIEYIEDSQYIYFLVQSEKDTEFLETRIRSFVEDLHVHFKIIDEDVFAIFKKAVVSSFKKKPRSLHSYCSSLWAKYLTGVVDINHENGVIDAVTNITRSDVINNHILSDPYVIKVSQVF